MMPGNRKYMAWALPLVLAAALAGGANAPAQEPRGYVGATACKACHDEQYESYRAYSKKAHSFRSIQRMQKGLTPQELQKCYECHTTGHGKPGGFVSLEKTPHLADLGCEACHGPGAAHIKAEDGSMIKAKPTVKDCGTCHNPERVEAFNYRPLIYGGGH